MRFLCRLIKLSVISSILFALPAFAAELKVIDNLGLTRAVRSVSQTGQVVVRIQGTPGDKTILKLSNVDGLNQDISGILNSDGTVVFATVPAGTWRVSLNGAPVTISEVKITQ